MTTEAKIIVPLGSTTTPEVVRRETIKILKRFEDGKAPVIDNYTANLLAQGLVPRIRQNKLDSTWLLAAASKDDVRAIIKWVWVESKGGATIAHATNGRVMHTTEIGSRHVWFGKTGLHDNRRTFYPVEDITAELIAEKRLPFKPYSGEEPRCGFPDVEAVKDFTSTHKVINPQSTHAWAYDYVKNTYVLPVEYDGSPTTEPRLDKPIAVEAEILIRAIDDARRISIEYDDSKSVKLLRISTYGTRRTAYVVTKEDA